jgi:DNA-binding HxlR family transcriptional regulator
MAANKHDSHKCSLAVLKLLGDFWNLSIIEALSAGEKRFSQLEREIPRVNPTTLSNRLRKLEEQKIVQRHEETLDKLSVVYGLTDIGRKILPILEQIKIFGDAYLSTVSEE